MNKRGEGPTEQRVIELVSQRLSAKQIASELGISIYRVYDLMAHARQRQAGEQRRMGEGYRDE